MTSASLKGENVSSFQSVMWLDIQLNVHVNKYARITHIIAALQYSNDFLMVIGVKII